ncbi:MAG: hypothetical protein HRU70_02235 [Phycisphaeraceae bacterium]|nr:MAG: hypothetical protein HRU70_02235 [Phycisphaeraceae bacterium]
MPEDVSSVLETRRLLGADRRVRLAAWGMYSPVFFLAFMIAVVMPFARMPGTRGAGRGGGVSSLPPVIDALAAAAALGLMMSVPVAVVCVLVRIVASAEVHRLAKMLRASGRMPASEVRRGEQLGLWRVRCAEPLRLELEMRRVPAWARMVFRSAALTFACMIVAGLMAAAARGRARSPSGLIVSIGLTATVFLGVMRWSADRVLEVNSGEGAERVEWRRRMGWPFPWLRTRLAPESVVRVSHDERSITIEGADERRIVLSPVGVTALRGWHAGRLAGAIRARLGLEMDGPAGEGAVGEEGAEGGGYLARTVERPPSTERT